MAHERLDEHAQGKLTGLLTAGDPNGEVTTAWHIRYPALAAGLVEVAELVTVEGGQWSMVGLMEATVAHPDRRVAPGPGVERTDRDHANGLAKRIKRLAISG